MKYNINVVKLLRVSKLPDSLRELGIQPHMCVDTAGDMLVAIRDKAAAKGDQDLYDKCDTWLAEFAECIG